MTDHDSSKVRGPTAYGERLRALRQARGLSQRQLGDMIGVSHVFLSDTERGGRPALSLARTTQILDALAANTAERGELLSFYCVACGARR